ncbi:MAG: thiamine pyrophosphate-binding protein [Deltaproteobacteria bacterium]|nr:thiamine pyrophosphate-binding protein [Deltaproteobacteria bacterium]
MKTKVSDIIAHYLHSVGIEKFFMVTGGGAMHLNNSLGTRLNYICCHHEQACAIAAEGYARTSGKLGVVNVTTGPGGLNTLTGVLGQWTDSVPVLYLSGQVKTSTTITHYPKSKLRQLGDQEVDIVRIVEPITKYAVSVTQSNDILYQLQKAIHIALSGRPGPVWLDIPIDVQAAVVEADDLRTYIPDEDTTGYLSSIAKVPDVAKLLENSKRPLLVAGNGINISGARKELIHLVDRLQIPVVTTFNGLDVIASSHPMYIGRIGIQGTRAGNFALQNADVLVEIGTRNNIRQTSYNWENFGKNAYKIVVDIDEAELGKPTLKPDMAVHMDAKVFIKALFKEFDETVTHATEWTSWCQGIKNAYPVVLAEYRDINEKVHPYYFLEKITSISSAQDVFVSGNGTVSVTMMQAAVVKEGQHLFGNSGCAAMGYDLPAAIGAAFALKKGQVICLAGDGSLQMNIQELQTVKQHDLPIKIFYFNNNGYHSIRQTQNNFFGGELIGCDKSSGVTFPDIIKIGKAYGLQTERIESHADIELNIAKVLNMKGPVLCEVMIVKNYIFSPKVSSKKLEDGTMVSSSLEDMFPYLNKDELQKNMLVESNEEEVCKNV